MNEIKIIAPNHTLFIAFCFLKKSNGIRFDLTFGKVTAQTHFALNLVMNHIVEFQIGYCFCSDSVGLVDIKAIANNNIHFE